MPQYMSFPLRALCKRPATKLAWKTLLGSSVVWKHQRICCRREQMLITSSWMSCPEGTVMIIINCDLLPFNLQGKRGKSCWDFWKNLAPTLTTYKLCRRRFLNSIFTSICRDMIRLVLGPRSYSLSLHVSGGRESMHLLLSVQKLFWQKLNVETTCKRGRKDISPYRFFRQRQILGNMVLLYKACDPPYMKSPMTLHTMSLVRKTKQNSFSGNHWTGVSSCPNPLHKMLETSFVEEPDNSNWSH